MTDTIEAEFQEKLNALAESGDVYELAKLYSQAQGENKQFIEETLLKAIKVREHNGRADSIVWLYKREGLSDAVKRQIEESLPPAIRNWENTGRFEDIAPLLIGHEFKPKVRATGIGKSLSEEFDEMEYQINLTGLNDATKKQINESLSAVIGTWKESGGIGSLTSLLELSGLDKSLKEQAENSLADAFAVMESKGIVGYIGLKLTWARLSNRVKATVIVARQKSKNPFSRDDGVLSEYKALFRPDGCASKLQKLKI